LTEVENPAEILRLRARLQKKRTRISIVRVALFNGQARKRKGLAGLG